ncbi:MAG: U32 family peptidase [Desulfovibrionaceae bacterium]|nr:U32 family peptidase [Desulfovibrionaceae bacterium]
MAPAGNRESFLAALAAGADAVYAGLKHFSARMQADNFSLSDLARLAELARSKGVRTYVAMNALLKPGDLEPAGRLIDRLARQVRPEALIVQDPGLPALARQAGYNGEIHISTLANLSHPAGLRTAQGLGAARVVLPRELDLDEIKAMDAACPDGLDLEVFVHGALCFSVSGRCYWSSLLGGKSGLRGRCVQPCRRLYRQGGPKGKPARMFSCQDLGLDVLTKTLLGLPHLRAWKIEGRKKGPHYVFYTVKAYCLLRDHAADPVARKTALDLLDQALGRPRSHSVFLPQRPFSPVDPGTDTGSGRMAGTLKSGPGGQKGGRIELYFRPWFPLLAGDLLRIGYEDEPGHQTVRLGRGAPKGGRIDLPRAKGLKAAAGTKVFLIDRREPELAAQLAALDRELAATRAREKGPSTFRPALPPAAGPAGKRYITLHRNQPKGRLSGEIGLWLEKRSLAEAGAKAAARVWWWLPPVIWPNEEQKYADLARLAQKAGARSFVLNAPWQIGLLDQTQGLRLVAGPFCNLANALALEQVRALGFSAAVASPELDREAALALAGQSPLPLGLVIRGMWPLCVSRYQVKVKTDQPIASPKGEVCWAHRIGGNLWLFPGWELDLTEQARDLEQAGYSLFVTMREPWPKDVPRTRRPGTFNWDLKLL